MRCVRVALRLLLDNGHVDIDADAAENAIRSPVMNRRNALFTSHDEGDETGLALPD